MDDLFEEDKERKSAEKNEVDWTDVCILHEIGFICFQETKVPKIPLETEIFKVEDKNLTKILDSNMKAKVEIDPSDEEFNIDNIEERNILEKLEGKVKLSERLLITEKLENGDKKIKIDSLDGDDISNYINDNNHKSDSDDLFKSNSIKTDLPKE